MNPEISNMGPMVTVPSLVLATWGGVEVDDGVDRVFGAEGYNTVEVFEAFWFEDSGVGVVFEVSVVDSDSDAVQS